MTGLLLATILAVGQAQIGPICRDYTVEIISLAPSERGYGSGTVIATNQNRAYVLTAKHVFRGKGLRAQVTDWQGATQPGNLLALSGPYDLALVETAIPAPDYKTACGRRSRPRKSIQHPDCDSGTEGGQDGRIW